MTAPGPNHARDLARRRVVNATQRLRYGAAVMPFGVMTAADEVEYLATVADWLEAFGTVLADGCDRSNTTAAAYDRLRADVSAMRRVLGTDDTSTERALVAANEHIAAIERAQGAS